MFQQLGNGEGVARAEALMATTTTAALTTPAPTPSSSTWTNLQPSTTSPQWIQAGGATAQGFLLAVPGTGGPRLVRFEDIVEIGAAVVAGDVVVDLRTRDGSGWRLSSGALEDIVQGPFTTAQVGGFVERLLGLTQAVCWPSREALLAGALADVADVAALDGLRRAA